MNRSLSKREKVLALILVVIALATAYFKLYLEPLNTKIATLESDAEEQQMEIQTNSAVIAKIKAMENEIAEAENDNDFKKTPAYDNSYAVMQELSSILKKTYNYSLTIGDAIITDYIVEKPFTIEYEIKTFQGVRNIIAALSDSKYVVEIGNIDVSKITSDLSEYGYTYITTVEMSYFEAIY